MFTQWTSPDESLTKLITLALQARQNAYVPYSNIMVGAVIESQNERCYTGCNVENSSYGLSMCAERVAVFKAISEGEKQFKRLVVVADLQSPITPCGACRQVFSDLLDADLQIVMVNTHGQIEIKTVRDLLPSPFGAACLQREGNQ